MSGGKQDIRGTIVSEAESSKGLGFKSIEDMRFFYTNIDKIQEIIGTKLNRIYGHDPKNQWVFEIASAVTEYFISLNLHSSISQLKTALAFYADVNRYNYDETCCPCFDNPGKKIAGEDILSDNGNIARSILGN